MTQSRYSSLSPAKNEVVEMFRGQWHGKQVEFERVFRGYRFSDGECEALCRDELLEVHGLERNGTQYSVVGSLQDSMFSGFSREFASVKFKPVRTISFDPEYRFETRHICYADGHVEPAVASEPERQVEDTSAEDEAFIDSFNLDAFTLENDDMEARMAAMIAAPTLPVITQISQPGEPPRFAPVFVLLSEEQLEAAAARAREMLAQQV